VFAAMVADDFKFGRGIFARYRFLRTAFRTPLRRHHITLVKNFLFFLREKKSFLTLDTWDLNIRHFIYLLFQKSVAQRLDMRNSIDGQNL